MGDSRTASAAGAPPAPSVPPGWPPDGPSARAGSPPSPTGAVPPAGTPRRAPTPDEPPDGSEHRQDAGAAGAGVQPPSVPPAPPGGVPAQGGSGPGRTPSAGVSGGPATEAGSGPASWAGVPPAPSAPPGWPPDGPSAKAGPPQTPPDGSGRRKDAADGAGAVGEAPPGPEGDPRPWAGVVGGGPPTYEAEPTALPAAEALALEQLVADTVLDGARYGTYTLRAASVRGDSARYRGEPRRDALLTARFGAGPAALVLVAVAVGNRHTEHAHLAAADATRWIGTAVGRSHARLAEDIRAGRRGDLKSGLHRLTDRGFGRLRARAAELGLEPEQYGVGLRCLLLSADPDCRTRVFFGAGAGGLFRLRDGVWQDIEPSVPEKADDAPAETPDRGDRLTADPDITTSPPPAEPFRFRASVARPGDTLLLCSNGLAEPLRGEPALAAALTRRWEGSGPPGMTQFLADIQLRVKGYADDRTAVGVWEA
ncbi:protein phosphatase 2C domain-containing protein [Streptomyces sp. PKU-EA00015]|uniref:protein phosphatase 2C domain-containing protein n=1 Tax=Streptomyces sp. PKU-EA00015 TaxID=2748326 RepID=UPI0015A267AF|nr:protein phosphatase 2C domain-containing protein [Streptomyces sp. PKU-EA00015]NWF26463.1 protein phosphatase 2C domain-containing protein [Streptomyces sp. PKU-EA00015]